MWYKKFLSTLQRKAKGVKPDLDQNFLFFFSKNSFLNDSRENFLSKKFTFDSEGNLICSCVSQKHYVELSNPKMIMSLLVNNLFFREKFKNTSQGILLNFKYFTVWWVSGDWYTSFLTGTPRIELFRITASSALRFKKEKRIFESWDFFKIRVTTFWW